MPHQFTCETCGAARTSERLKRFCNRACSARRPRSWLQKPLVDRFWARVRQTETCWLWTGRLDKNGYGHLKAGDGSRKAIGAHVVSWVLHNGALPDGLWVLHTCDNPPCVRPDHLYAGTLDDNVRDRVVRGRSAAGATHGRNLHPERWTLENRPRGETHGRHVLTEDQVREIRLMAENIDASQETIAAMYGVSRPTISLILNGKRWSHL